MKQAVTSQTSTIPQPLPVPKNKLRELGIYRLPDKREFVVSTLYLDGCNLYTTSSCKNAGNAEYWVDKNGRLLQRGRPTQWSLEDLSDTGRTTTYPKPKIL